MEVQTNACPLSGLNCRREVKAPSDRDPYPQGVHQFRFHGTGPSPHCALGCQTWMLLASDCQAPRCPSQETLRNHHTVSARISLFGLRNLTDRPFHGHWRQCGPAAASHLTHGRCQGSPLGRWRCSLKLEGTCCRISGFRIPLAQRQAAVQ